MQLNWNYNMDEISFATYFGVTIIVSLLCGGVLLVMFLMSEYITKLISRRKKRKSFWDFGEK